MKQFLPIVLLLAVCAGVFHFQFLFMSAPSSLGTSSSISAADQPAGGLENDLQHLTELFVKQEEKLNMFMTGIQESIQAVQEASQKISHEDASPSNQSPQEPNDSTGKFVQRRVKDYNAWFTIEGKSPTIPLDELAASAEAEKQTCSEGLKLVTDTLLDPNLALAGGRRIPRIIHITAFSRCIVPVIADNVDDWRFEDHSLFLHDDPAVERLLYRDWPEFPMLHKVLACLPNKGAIMADIWRVLLLWEYGGIYTDMDTGIKEGGFNGTTITAEMDGFFVQTPLGKPSQWFMAVSPRHPLMYLAMNRIIRNIWLLKDIGTFPVVFVTGPAVIGDALGEFMGIQQNKNFKSQTYVGLYNRSIVLEGEQGYNVRHFVREVVSKEVKFEAYKKSGMTHISKMGLKDDTNILGSCIKKMLSMEQIRDVMYEPSWQPKD